MSINGEPVVEADSIDFSTVDCWGELGGIVHFLHLMLPGRPLLKHFFTTSDSFFLIPSLPFMLFHHCFNALQLCAAFIVS